MLIYLLIINIIAFIMYGIDKWKAHRKQWRISEKMLLFLAVIGGSAGALAGMYIFHHKTLHKKFTIGVPAYSGGTGNDFYLYYGEFLQIGRGNDYRV